MLRFGRILRGRPMFNRRQVVLGALLLVATVRLAPPASTSLPDRLTDQQFWSLVTDSSEPGGTFRSDNLLSNELQMQYVIPELLKTVPPGRAYLGVGPEQNFTYISALKPSIAFIIDIRRGNLNLHLLYKALFELSPDRAAFVSRLFSKSPPRRSWCDGDGGGDLPRVLGRRDRRSALQGEPGGNPARCSPRRASCR